MKIILVGDRPSQLNTNQYVPFVGTPSHRTLLVWLKDMEIDDYMIFNSHTQLMLDNIFYQWLHQGNKVVALGNNAAKRLDGQGIGYFKLPHPSPRNRLLNDKEFIKKQLLECKQYIKEIL